MFCAERNLASGAGDFAEAARRSGALLPAHHGDGPLMLVLSRASPMLMQGGAGFDPVWEPPGKCAARNWTERVVRLG